MGPPAAQPQIAGIQNSMSQNSAQRTGSADDVKIF
jgi:hypothetical protein